MKNIKEREKLCVQALVLWVLDEKSEQYNEEERNSFITHSFIAQVLLKKLEVFAIDVYIPTYLLVIIEVCVENNPGMAQVMLAEILNNCKDLKPGYVISSNDFANTYGHEFPVIDYSDLNNKYYKKFETLWDSQKYIGEDNNMLNKCDTKEYWESFFKEP